MWPEPSSCSCVARMCRRIRCILRARQLAWQLSKCSLSNFRLSPFAFRYSRLHFHLLSCAGHLDWHMHSAIVTAFQIGSQLSFRVPRPLLNCPSLSLITFPLHSESHFIFIIPSLSAGTLHNPFLHLEDYHFFPSVACRAHALHDLTPLDHLRG